MLLFLPLLAPQGPPGGGGPPGTPIMPSPGGASPIYVGLCLLTIKASLFPVDAPYFTFVLNKKKAKVLVFVQIRLTPVKTSIR